MSGSSGKLKEEHKAFIVQRLAAFESPKQTVKALKEEFGVQLSPQGAEAYDPTKFAGRRLNGRWRALFEHTRERFLTDLDSIPEANRPVRVQYLAQAARSYRERGAYMQMARLLEQIAKEIGNVYTNRRQLMGREGRPTQVEEMSLEQVDRELAMLLAEADIAK